MARLTAEARTNLVEARRRQIMEAASGVFSARGYHGATMREVAAHAGLAPGTLYLYLPSKRDLLLGVWEHLVVHSLAPLLAETGSRNLVDLLSAFLHNRLRLMRGHAALLRLVFHVADHDEAFRRALADRLAQTRCIAEGHIRQAIQAGVIRQVEPRITARLLSSVIVGYLFTERIIDPAGWPYSDDQVAGEIARLLAYGVISRSGGPPPGAAASDGRASDGQRGEGREDDHA